MNFTIRRTLIAAVAAFPWLCAPAMAADVFHGGTINIVVGFGPGGGYDEYGRLLARHMGKHVPGHPNFVVQNMPGAASLKAVQYLQSTAPNDGTAIVIFNFGQITSSLVLPPKNMKLDFRNFAWIGSMNRDVSVCYVWKERFKAKNALELAEAKQVNYGLTGVGSASYFNQMMLIGVFGVHLKQIKGYGSSKEKQIAIERGELDGDCGEWNSVPEDWLRDNKVTVLLRYSRHQPEGMPSSIPYAGDLAPTDVKKQIIKLLTTATDMGRPFITRKDVPADRLAILRKAFDETVKDPELLADAKRIDREIAPMTAKEVHEALDELYAMPKNIVDEAKAMLNAKR
jgi:tripartite-type tricarboxylate transporter receptor subunit TctC